MMTPTELLTTLDAADEAHAALARYVAEIELQTPSLLHSALASLETSRSPLRALADEPAPEEAAIVAGRHAGPARKSLHVKRQRGVRKSTLSREKAHFFISDGAAGMYDDGHA